MAYIELRDVSKAFYADRAKSRARVALDRVSLEIERGEFVSLIGPSGCGKTVTLSMIAGFAQPTVGEVLFEGEAVCGPDPRRGVVFQEYSLLPWLTVEQNVFRGEKLDAKNRERHRLGRDGRTRASRVVPGRAFRCRRSSPEHAFGRDEAARRHRSLARHGF